MKNESDTPRPARRIVLPNTRAYDKAGKGHYSLFSRDHCCVCGKYITLENVTADLLLTSAIDGSREFAILHPSDATREERLANLWVAPIGSDCLRKHPELKPFVIGAEGAAVQPPAPDSWKSLVARLVTADAKNEAQAAEITRLREALAGVASYARYGIRRVIDSAASHQEFKLEAQEAWDKMERALEGKQ